MIQTQPGDAWCVTVQHGMTERCRRHHREQEGKSPDTAVTTVSNMPGHNNSPQCNDCNKVLLWQAEIALIHS